MQPRIYTYKITFEEVPYYYYGVHKEKYFNEEYWGSPKTHKWCWELYTPKKQTLEIFDYTDEGWLEANRIEQRLIKPFYNTDKWCLNRNCGGTISLEINRKIGKMIGNANKILNRGIFSMNDVEKHQQRSRAGKISGKITKEKGTGIFGMSDEEKLNRNKNAGKLGGYKIKELSVGIFGMTEEEKIERNKKGANTINSIKWKCTITGHISTSGPLTLYQKHRGIDPSNRIRISL
jgi:hypothetical protein